MGLAVTAFAMDQTLWVWSGQLQAVCFDGRNPHGTLSGNLFFAAPFLMLLVGLVCLWQLPRSGVRDKFYLGLGAILLTYLVFSGIVWHETAYLDASTEELSTCLHDVLHEYDLAPTVFHWVLWFPCGAFLFFTLIMACDHLLKVGRARTTDSPR